ncbi:MAG TPA: hypothetical protein VJ779_02000, partial [Acetobacteraceae bacterium]|nr:hypothetical protein [Acetobacteraceae bacterium]
TTRHGVGGWWSARNRAIFGVIAPAPFQCARLFKAADGVDETVERTSDLSEIARTLDVVA